MMTGQSRPKETVSSVASRAGPAAPCTLGDSNGREHDSASFFCSSFSSSDPYLDPPWTTTPLPCSWFSSGIDGRYRCMRSSI